MKILNITNGYVSEANITQIVHISKQTIQTIEENDNIDVNLSTVLLSVPGRLYFSLLGFKIWTMIKLLLSKK